MRTCVRQHNTSHSPLLAFKYLFFTIVAVNGNINSRVRSNIWTLTLVRDNHRLPSSPFTQIYQVHSADTIVENI